MVNRCVRQDKSLVGKRVEVSYVVSAEQLLRHKSSKRSFRMVYWIAVAINLSSLGYLASDEGRWILEMVGKMEI
jgi:hypothetical protein